MKPGPALLAASLALAPVAMPTAARASGTVVVAMTAGEVPITTGTPDQGFEGCRFVALDLHDGNSRAGQDPFCSLIRHVSRSQWAPAGSSWGRCEDAETERLIAAVNAEFDGEKRTALLAQLNERMNDQAVMIWVAHDVNPRALGPKVHGFVQAQSWFQDMTRVSVDP